MICIIFLDCFYIYHQYYFLTNYFLFHKLRSLSLISLSGCCFYLPISWFHKYQDVFSNSCYLSGTGNNYLNYFFSYLTRCLFYSYLISMPFFFYILQVVPFLSFSSSVTLFFISRKIFLFSLFIYLVTFFFYIQQVVP